MDKPRRYNPLQQLGFESYTEYLESSLWHDVRQRVLERAHHVCECCSCPATQVHHFRYCKSAFSGLNIDSLVAICKPCHDLGSYKQDGTKRRHHDANRIIFDAMRVKDSTNAGRIAYVMNYRTTPGQTHKQRASREERQAHKERRRASRVLFKRRQLSGRT